MNAACAICKYTSFCFSTEIATKENYSIAPCSTCKNSDTCEGCGGTDGCRYTPIK